MGLEKADADLPPLPPQDCSISDQPQNATKEIDVDSFIPSPHRQDNTKANLDTKLKAENKAVTTTCNKDKTSPQDGDYQNKNNWLPRKGTTAKGTTRATSSSSADDADDAALNDIISQIQELPSSQQAPPRQSQPGAYAETNVGTFPPSRLIPPVSLTNSMTSGHPSITTPSDYGSAIFDNDDDDHDHDDLQLGRSVGGGDCGSGGLVKATPVPIAQEAMPVDLEAGRRRRRRQGGGVPPTTQEVKEQDKLHSSRMMRALLCCFVIVLFGMIGAGVGVLVKKNTSQDNDNDNNHNTSTEAELDDNQWNATTALQWEVLPNLPNYTIETLLNDRNGTSPQHKAFLWIQNDPYLANYSQARRLQRFALSTLYYSTNGENWTNQGGELATVVYGLGKAEGGGQPGRGGGGGGGEGAGGGGDDDGGGNGRELVGTGDGSNNATTAEESKEEEEEETIGATVVSCSGRTCGVEGAGDAGREQIIKSERWLSYEHGECEWFNNPDRGALCSGGPEKTIVHINIFNNNLQGTIPHEIALLTDLELLALHRNKITGTLTTHIGTLSKLKLLALRGNSMTGHLPSELGLLSQLTDLIFLRNSFVGSIPPEVFRLPKIQDLKAMQNDISGTIPADIGMYMTNLEVLGLTRNQRISGSLPSTLGLCTNLVKLSLSQNTFTGQLPTNLGLLKNLTDLILDASQITGSIPSELGTVPLLRRLDLQKNIGLTGMLPTELGLLNNTLGALLISGTSVTGVIPEELCSIDLLSFDCSEVLCGCNCPCPNTTMNQTI